MCHCRNNLGVTPVTIIAGIWPLSFERAFSPERCLEHLTVIVRSAATKQSHARRPLDCFARKAVHLFPRRVIKGLVHNVPPQLRAIRFQIPGLARHPHLPFVGNPH